MRASRSRNVSANLSLPVDLLAWAQQLADERDMSRNVVVRVALERMRHDVQVYGDVGGLPKPIGAHGR